MDLPFDLTTGQVVVIALRLLVPLLVPRFPFWGGVAAMLLDGTDVIIVEFFGSGGMGDHYHQLDKILDLYYLGIELWASLRWTEVLPRQVSIGLFVYRVIGVALFELFGERWLLFVFPNLFENWWLYVLIVRRFIPRLEPRSTRSVVIPLLLLLVPKMVQEYILHFAEAQPWNFIKEQMGLR